ncbi:MAG: pyridoxamine 5'-phosphate oxidase family protein [Acidobacteriota bacterium]
MRRSEKEISDPEIIRSVFERGDICRLGLINKGLAYIVPMNFGYKGGYLYFHSANEGTKIDLLKQNPKVSFEVDINHVINKAESACNWGASYISVIGSGTIEFIKNHKEKERALKLIMEKYSGRKEWTFSKKNVDQTAIFTLLIKEISCKGSL